MRPDAVFFVDGGTPVLLSLLALIVPLCAFVYCTGGKNTSGARTIETSNKSNKTKSVTKSSMGSSNGTAAVPEAIVAKAEDNRAQWATNIVETQSPKSLFTEFSTQLKDYTAPGRTTSCSEQHSSLNRYPELPCFDQDRVILKGPLDYIHANYMNAPDGIKYIATQGPMKETQCEFWQMVVQEEAHIVLQLCKFKEGNDEKCIDYWPCGDKEEKKELENFTIRKIDKQEEIVPGTVKTKLRIESKTVNRTIQHIFCDSWPDKLAPTDPAIMIKIWSYVKANRGTGPIVVHCSAGIGRTATFIGISYGVEMLKKPGTTMVDVIKELRRARSKAVQTHVQYAFLHAALIDMFMQANLLKLTPKITEFMDAYKKMVESQMKKKEEKEKTDGRSFDQSSPCSK